MAIKPFFLSQRFVYYLLFTHVFVFIITRWVFYNTGFLPTFTRDIQEYYGTVLSFHEGTMPLYNIVTFPYPIILSLLGSNFSILFLNSLATLVSSCFLIYTLKNRLLFYPFVFISVLILFFFNSGGVLAAEFTVNPVSLFTSLTTVLFCFLVRFIDAPNKKSAIIISLLVLFALNLRPQGVFCFAFVLFIIGYFIYKKQFANAATVSILNLSVLMAIISYHVYSGIGFTLYPNKLYGIVKIGTNINTLTAPNGVSLELKNKVDSVNASFDSNHDYIVQNSWDYNDLSTIFNVNAFDKSWAFFNDLETNKRDVELITDASTTTPWSTIKLKYYYYVSLKYFDLHLNNRLFFINYFNNQRYYFCNTLEYSMFDTKLKQDVCFKEFAVYLNPEKKELACKELALKEEELYQNKLFNLCSLFDFIAVKILTSPLWLVLFFVGLLDLLIILIKSRFVMSSKNLRLTLSLVFIMGNIVVFSLSIVPSLVYILPTKFFLYLFIGYWANYLLQQCREKKAEILI
jgi:hypothetical protein